MRRSFGRKMAIGVVAVVLFVGSWYWMSRPRDLATITADYHLRSVRLAAELENADDERALEIVNELATFGGMAEPAVPVVLDYSKRLEERYGGTSDWKVINHYKRVAKIGDPRFVPLIVRGLERERNGRHALTAWCQMLGELRAVEGVEPILRMTIRGISDDVQVTAMIAFVQIAKDDPGAILNAVTHPELEMRQAACRIIAGARFTPRSARIMADEALALLRDAEHPARVELLELMVWLDRVVDNAQIGLALQERRSKTGVSSTLRTRIEEAATTASLNVASIRDFLSDENFSTRVAAVRALVEHAERDVAIREIRTALNGDDTYFVLECIGSLGRLKATEAVDDLLRLAEQKKPFYRLHSVMALTEIGDVRALPLFRSELYDRNHADYAAKGIVAVTGPEHLDELRGFVAAKAKLKKSAKLQLLLHLDRLDERSYQHEIDSMFETTSSAEPQYIVGAFSSLIDTDGGKEKLLEMLHTGTDSVAAATISPLVQLMGDDALPYMRDVISSAGPKTVGQIVTRLHWMDSDEAVDALIRIMEQGDSKISAAYALREVTGENYGDIVEAWRAWYRERH